MAPSITAKIDAGALAPSAPSRSVSIPLPGRRELAQARRIGGGALRGGDYSWIGRTVEGWTVVLVAHGNDVAGAIHTDDAAYQIEPGQAGQVSIARRPSTSLPWHSLRFAAVEGAAPRAPVVPADVSSDPTVDVIVEYTELAQSTCPNVATDIEVAITETNQASADSQVDLSFRLVEVVRPSDVSAPSRRFRETGNIDRDLSMFQTVGDGELDEIHPRRDQSGADVAVLVVAEDDDGLGDAADIMTEPETAFTVVDCRYLVGVPLLAHELGHVMGLRHDNDPRTTPYPDGHGYVFPSRDAPRWATIMAAPCGDCVRTFLWSNPNVRYPATGSNAPPVGERGASNAARALGDAVKRVSQFRPTRTPP